MSLAEGSALGLFQLSPLQRGLFPTAQEVREPQWNSRHRQQCLWEKVASGDQSGAHAPRALASRAPRRLAAFVLALWGCGGRILLTINK